MKSSIFWILFGVFIGHWLLLIFMPKYEDTMGKCFPGYILQESPGKIIRGIPYTIKMCEFWPVYYSKPYDLGWLKWLQQYSL